jgi:predicted  nucleic acid-binding Zn-ribbon protein
MDQKDLEQIRQVFKEEFFQGFGVIWEGNLEPAFNAVNERIDKLTTRVEKLEQHINGLEKTMEALSHKVTNYLELSDKRYLELKRKNLILAKWIQQIADKTGTKIDLKEFEEIFN